MQLSMMTAQAAFDVKTTSGQQLVHRIGDYGCVPFRGLYNQDAALARVWPVGQDRLKRAHIAGLGHEHQIAVIRGACAAAHKADAVIAMAAEPKQRGQAGWTGDADAAGFIDAGAPQKVSENVAQGRWRPFRLTGLGWHMHTRRPKRRQTKCPARAANLDEQSASAGHKGSIRQLGGRISGA